MVPVPCLQLLPFRERRRRPGERAVWCAWTCSDRASPFSPRGTHGYMAPEVLQKGTAYDSSADWFSLGCMLFKLLRG